MLAPEQSYRQKFYTEEIFYWLRKTADELISILYLLKYFKDSNQFPKKIEIGSIGDLLNPKKTDGKLLRDLLTDHISALERLNEISNGYKHSLINSQIHNYQGLDYPVAFAYTLKYNDLSNPANFHSYDLREVLRNYDSFLARIKSIFLEEFNITQFKMKTS